MRIVSLVPAGTDILFALGAATDIVGVSHECAIPAGAPALPRLTRSVVQTTGLSSAEIDAAIAGQVATDAPVYEVDGQTLEALRPDLILTQGLCDVCALPARVVENALCRLSWRPALLSLDAHSVDGVLDSIHEVGKHTGRRRQAQLLVSHLRSRLDQVALAVAKRPRVPVVCLEWLDPPYACGHWIPEMVERAGGTELLGQTGMRSAPVPWAEIERTCPAAVIAMPCGFDLPRAAQDLEQVAARTPWLRATGAATVYAAAGTYFTQPGPSLVTGVEVLASVLHPDAAAWSVPPGAITRWRAPAPLRKNGTLRPSGEGAGAHGKGGRSN
ncbi:MAG TPA: ABC transporter substrate-binding protein [Gemmatimonadaceae bacterium]|nr:ABC transporter substrate-binding protein [Gemmatimonadaceae bacterium]